MNGTSITHASLFSGIGAPELAATWMGWRNLFHCEINEKTQSRLMLWARCDKINKRIEMLYQLE